MGTANVKAAMPRLLVAAAGVALTVAVTTVPAAAKGPEAATLTGPGIHEPLQLLEDAPRDVVELLMEQTGIWFGIGDLPTRITEPVGSVGEPHTLTWINSGPPGAPLEGRTIVQYLYLDAAPGPLIHTPAQQGLEGWGGSVIGWFAAPPSFIGTLTQLGLPTKSPAAPAETSAPTETAPPMSEAAPTSEASPPPTAPSSAATAAPALTAAPRLADDASSGVQWGIALGAPLVALAVFSVNRHRRHAPNPRRRDHT